MAPLVSRAHEKLWERLNEFPLKLPKDDKIMEILQIIFTEQEAEMISKFTSFQKMMTVQEFARTHGYPESVVGDVFHALAKRDLILYKKKEGREEFCIRPFVVGMYEALFCNWRNQDQDSLVPVAENAHDYFMNTFFKAISGSKFPWARVIPAMLPLERLRESRPDLFVETSNQENQLKDSVQKGQAILNYATREIPKKARKEGIGGVIKMVQEEGNMIVDNVSRTVSSFLGSMFAPAKKSTRRTPPIKDIPIEAEIPASMHVHAYEEIKKYVEAATAITITDCACRKHHAILNAKDSAAMKPNCDHAIEETCMQFFYDSEEANEFNSLGGKAISKQKALQIIEDVERDGLVHTSFNSKEKIEFLCNCCPCCCGILGTITRIDQNVGAFVNSNFLPFLNSKSCKQCGNCALACPMKAITFEKGSNPSINLDICIGCGVCAVKCPTQAIHMRKRKEHEPALDTVDAHLRFANQKY